MRLERIPGSDHVGHCEELRFYPKHDGETLKSFKQGKDVI